MTRWAGEWWLVGWKPASKKSCEKWWKNDERIKIWERHQRHPTFFLWNMMIHTLDRWSTREIWWLLWGINRSLAMTGYHGSKSGCCSEALREHSCLEGDGSPGGFPWWSQSNVRGADVGHVPGSVECRICRWWCLLPLGKLFYNIFADGFPTQSSRTQAQSMLLLKCCKLRTVQELVQLPALRSCLLEALRHQIVTETWV